MRRVRNHYFRSVRISSLAPKVSPIVTNVLRHHAGFSPAPIRPSNCSIPALRPSHKLPQPMPQILPKRDRLHTSAENAKHEQYHPAQEEDHGKSDPEVAHAVLHLLQRNREISHEQTDREEQDRGFGEQERDASQTLHVQRLFDGDEVEVLHEVSASNMGLTVQPEP